jgi:hypothetical protein
MYMAGHSATGYTATQLKDVWREMIVEQDRILVSEVGNWSVARVERFTR